MHDIEATLRRRHVSPAIIARAVRLNPNPRAGERLRGIHYKSDPRWLHGWFGRGEFIRRHGREAWDALPRQAIRKEGRRQYVTREAEQDRAWLYV